MRDRESIIFACLDGPHTTCMFDMCSMAVDCRPTATVSDREAVQSGFFSESPAFRRRRKEILGSFTNCSLLLRSSFLPSSFLPIISSLVKKCNYFSSKVFSNERSPTRRTDRRTDGGADRPSSARARRPHTQGDRTAATDKSDPSARAGPLAAKVKEEGGIINILDV